MNTIKLDHSRDSIKEADISKSQLHHKTKRLPLYVKLVILIGLIYLIRTFLFDSYEISSESMEGTLIPGDKVIISKIAYGPRIPTVIGIPFISDDNLLRRVTGIRPYINLRFIPYLRVPGLAKIQRNDIFAFNFPSDDNDAIDVKTTYIKRCVGIPGDKISIREGNLYVNEKDGTKSAFEQRTFNVISKGPLTEENLDHVSLTNFDRQFNLLKLYKEDKLYRYRAFLTKNQLNALKCNVWVKRVYPDTVNVHLKDLDIYPHSTLYKANLENMPSITLPKKNESISFSKANVYQYLPLLKQFEGEQNVIVNRFYQMIIDGKVTNQYVFKNNYYFALGDNRGNSYDSRYWGPIPESHIIGKVAIKWWSENGNGVGSKFFQPVK